MDDVIIAIILGIIEGVTEFLPISSTGHLILANNFLGFTGEFADSFDVVIQFGAILSVLVYFRNKLFPFGKGKSAEQKKETWSIWKKTFVGMIPAGIVGFSFGLDLQDALFNPYVVAAALIVGGFALLIIEGKKRPAHIDSFASLTYKTAFLIGLIQCLAYIPGTSRSAATIIGAMLLGTTRLIATEYSFYLAIPTLTGASAYSLYKSGIALGGNEMQLLVIGLIVSFFVAWAVIAGFMDYISKKDFKLFGYYRIVLGAVVLAYYAMM
ncbi:MAG: undecaprenyl-diphosphate phosphatase [Candidatus Altiarchaeia archaeon]